MIDRELLDILCCPETKQGVALADDGLVKKINDDIAAGNAVNRGGAIVREPIDAGLLREDRKFLYPVREDIPIMLIDEAIPVQDI